MRPHVLVLAVLVALPGCVEQLEAFVYEPAEEVVEPLAEEAVVPATERDLSLTWRHEAMTVVAHDGIALNVDVFVPDATSRDGVSLPLEGPFPVVLVQSPYFQTAKFGPERFPISPFYFAVLSEFVLRGYAVAFADLRGTAWSDGCMDLAGPNEQADAVTVVEALGTAAWSNGRVGMIGVSYDGLTQIMAAAGNAPHLAAIVPIAPITDWYHAVGKGGAKYREWTPMTPLTYNVFIGMGVTPPSTAPDPASLVNPEEPDPADPRLQRANDQSCAAVNQVGSDDPSGLYNVWMKERDLRPLASSATAPMYYVHGLVDLKARPDHIDPWFNDYGGPKRGFLWQMTHASPDGPNTGRGDEWWRSMIAWFDHHLLGLENGVNATYGTVEVQDTLGRWRNETAWPPLDAAPTAFPLAPEAILTPGEAPPAGAASWRDDPREAGGTLGTKSALPLQGSTDTRLVFRGAPLAEPLHFAGRPVAHLAVSTDRPTTHVVARLYEILPDGSWVLVNEGVHSLLLRNSLETPEPVTPGSTVTVDVAMQPGDFVFRAGHGIGLTITSSDNDYVLPSGTLATSTLHFGESALVLPTIERDDFTRTTWGTQQPRWLGPHAWGYGE